MNREIYKRVAPHLDRTKQDGGVTTDNMSDLFLLQRSNEQYKDYLKLSFCPELHGYKKDTRSNVDYITKGYSANSIQQELGNTNYWNLGQVNIGPGVQSTQINSLVAGKQYVVVGLKNNDLSINYGTGWVRFSTSEKIIFTAQSFWFLFKNLSSTETFIFNPEIKEYIPNDLTQTSSANQPYLDKIAPAEKLSAKNPNGGSNYLTHPTISFGVNEGWSVETTFCIITNHNNSVGDFIYGKQDSTFQMAINLSDNSIVFYNNGTNIGTLTSSISLSKFAGKICFLHIINSNNTIKLYINGVLCGSRISIPYGFTGCIGGADNVLYQFNGNIYSHHIFSKALSASEVAERSAILRSIFPEIPFTRIGDQIWSVRNYEAAVTPQGNLIPEVQANGNVEQFLNGTFTTDTNWGKIGNATITNGVGNFFGAGDYIYQPNIPFINNAYYKLKYTIVTSNNGTLKQSGGSNPFPDTILDTTIGTHTLFIKTINSNNNFLFHSEGFIGSIDNVSLELICWSGSQELYDGIYAQTAEAASSVEKVVNGGFDTDSNWSKSGGWTISSGVAKGNGLTSYLSQTILTVGKYYKVTFTVLNYVSGSVNIDPITFDNPILRTSNGTYTVYGLAKSNVLWIYGSSANLSIDNVSVKELGLSDATSISNYTYAAVKAAAMWCHYGNDVTLGAVYGKLYNWFAVKLLQMDIDYYNANNPTTPWGWRVPTQSDFNTLATTLGGISVAGCKMKTVGTTYWNSPNTGADNSSGFSGIGSSRRMDNGSFTILGEISQYTALDRFFYLHSSYNSTQLNDDGFTDTMKKRGHSIRLIKA